MKVYIFGATSSPSCAAFALRQTAVDFGGDFEATISTAIEPNFYVDDCLLSVPNVAMAFKMVELMTSILRNAGFKLTKWISNNQETIDSISKPEKSKTLRVGALVGSTNERVLGDMGDINFDGFRFDVCLPWTPCTKRGLLFTMNSLFDPFGLSYL